MCAPVYERERERETEKRDGERKRINIDGKYMFESKQYLI